MPQPQTPFQASLQPASFRGVPFGVIGSQFAAGRRVEVHEYPFRDTPFTEDLGRRARRIAFTAFLLGDDVAAQTSALISAVEQKGAGVLIHPALGMMMMQPEAPSEFTDEWDKGRLCSVKLSFVEPGQDIYPLGNADTQAATQSAALDAGVGAGTDFNETITDVANGGSGAAAEGVPNTAALDNTFQLAVPTTAAIDNSQTPTVPPPAPLTIADGP